MSGEGVMLNTELVDSRFGVTRSLTHARTHARTHLPTQPPTH
jgi:hypothetical protein